MSSGLFYLNETDFTVKETQKGKTFLLVCLCAYKNIEYARAWHHILGYTWKSACCGQISHLSV